MESIVKKSELEGTCRIDAEYYQLKYDRNREFLNRFNLYMLGDICEYITNGATPYHEDLTAGEVRFLTAEHIYDLYIDYTNSKYIKKEYHTGELKRTALKNGDLLVTIKGRVGNAAVVFDLQSNTNINQDVARLILKVSWNPFYVASFLNTIFGKLQSEQLSTNQINPFLGLGNLKHVKIPPCPPELAKEVETFIQESQTLLRNSESLYLQAERMLLTILGLDNFDFSQPNYYSVPLSQAQGLHRVDVEYFQPKYDKLIKHLTKTGKTKLLGEIASYIKRGLQPTYIEDGEVMVVNSQHLGRYLLNIEGTERTDYNCWETTKRARLEKDDVLIYSTGAYVGRTNVWLEDQKGIASNHVTIIRKLKDCNPVYLSVYLNALPGLLQAEKWATGSGQRELYPEPIAKFYIYLPSEGFQTKIANLVIQSYEARKKAKSLLEEAKKKVEEMIEKESFKNR